MPESYRISIGGLYKQENQNIFKYSCKWLWTYSMRKLLYMIIFTICFVVTGYIFVNCISVNFSAQKIPQIKLGDCISLGSIFATFGSAIIAFLSLTSAHQLSSFHENGFILNEEFSKLGIQNWRRWDFLPRFGRERMSDGKYQYNILQNAELEFSIEDREIAFFVPSVEQDFKDLPVFCSWLKLQKNRKSYLKYLQKQSHIEDLFIWDCLMTLYKNIIVYKLSQLGIWIGTSYIINSIIYAFFYSQLYPYVYILLK